MSLKELVAARHTQQRELRTQLKERKRAVKQASAPAQTPQDASLADDNPQTSQLGLPSVSRLVPPRFMAQISSEFVRKEEERRREGDG